MPLPAKGEIKVYHTPDGAPYVICNSTHAFVNPTAPDSHRTCCEEINQTLNLNLGQSWITRDNRLGRLLLWWCRWCDVLLFEWWETIPMYIYKEWIPLTWKRVMIRSGWKIFLHYHKTWCGKRTGLHPSQSYHYHAMTTLLFSSKFVAWTPRRMRFFLSQIHTNAPNDPPPPERIQIIQQDMTTEEFRIPSQQTGHGTVQGWYIRSPKATVTTTHENPTSNDRHGSSRNSILFWIYGGAYLAGDVRGNSAVADYLAIHTHSDAVFVPKFRLAPEADLLDVLWDVCLAFYWLLQQHKTQPQQPPIIYILGVSSGAAIAVRLLQLLAQHRRHEDLDVPDYFRPLLSRMTMVHHSSIGGAVLFHPYVDYEQLYPHERTGSFAHYAKHDLIVNEAVQEYGLPYLKDFIPILTDQDHPPTQENDNSKDNDNYTANRMARRKQSPIHQSCQGLPPLCVITSQHEAVYDMTCELVNRARSEGVSVTMGMWKYMCHVFEILHGFLPEGQICMDFVVEWIQEQQQQHTFRRDNIQAKEG
jgi:acetyl esterase/lipase